MPTPEPTKADLLATVGWDLRALGEAQLRNLTAMQRCIEEYRESKDRNALAEIRKHIAEMRDRSTHVGQALKLMGETLDDLGAPRR